MNAHYKNILIFLSLISYLSSKNYYSEPAEQIKKGNLALPESQQPNPLFGFGQNIIGENVMQTYITANYLRTNDSSFAQTIETLIYGVRKDLSILLNIPIANKLKTDKKASSGLQDLIFQLEYAFYSKSQLTYTNEATFVTSISIPTGSTKKTPPLGTGFPNLFVGFTANHTSINWFLYTSLGINFPTKTTKKINLGNQFLYQFGIARNIIGTKNIIFDFMVEFFGIKISNSHNLNSNTFYIGPSLWLSTKHFIAQFGVAFPISRKLNPNNNYWISSDIAFTF